MALVEEAAGLLDSTLNAIENTKHLSRGGIIACNDYKRMTSDAEKDIINELDCA